MSSASLLELPIGATRISRPAVRAISDDGARAGCRVTMLGEVVPVVPPLPRSLDGRRLDAFEAYRARIGSLCQQAPMQLYTVEVPNFDIAYESLVVSGGTSDVRFTDLFRYGEQSDAFYDGQPVLDLPGRSLVIAEGYAASYYHFMFNSLVRLAVVMHTHPRLAFDHLVVSDDSPPFVRQAMEMLGVSAQKIVSFAPGARVRCERAWLGQYLSELVYPHPLAVQLLQRMFPSALAGNRRLLIVRRSVRAVTNAAEVLSILSPMGFEAVSCETLSLAEQTRLFGSAEAVIAPHGAGLANMIFCPPGTRVVEMMSPRFVETIFWFLATSCRHDHSILISPGEDAPLENKLGPGGWKSDCNDSIEVDTEALRRLCSMLGF